MSKAARHLGLLKFLCKCKKSQRKGILNCLDKDQVHAICECAENILRGTVKLSEKQKLRLKKHRAILVNLANHKICWKKKKRIVQKGDGILTTLLGIAIPALASAFGT